MKGFALDSSLEQLQLPPCLSVGRGQPQGVHCSCSKSTGIRWLLGRLGKRLTKAWVAQADMHHMQLDTSLQSATCCLPRGFP